MKEIRGRIVDIHNREIYNGVIYISEGKIKKIERKPVSETHYIIPGFIDAHVHMESSMLTPANFGRMVVQHGTIAVVSDPHEIANVTGTEGLRFMIEDIKQSPISCFLTIPSCVPATPFDCAGATISASDVQELAATGEFVALSEMMNVPGVLNQDPEVMQKIKIAKDYGIPIDGHAPLLSGETLKTYINTGISTDHESSLLEEAKEKLDLGMYVLIRQGSAARNYDALKSLIRTNPNMVMFCTDDSHPDELEQDGHIDKLVRQAIADGYDLFDVLRIASVNVAKHYHLPVGLLRPGDMADFLIVEDLKKFQVEATYIKGNKEYDRQKGVTATAPLYNKTEIINNFNHELISEAELIKPVTGTITAIGIEKDELITTPFFYTPVKPYENLESDIDNDLLKIVYINRYHNGQPQVAYIHGFGMKQGAFASSVGHDSHNIVATGCSDADIVKAVNAIIQSKGSLSVVEGNKVQSLPLPLGGIISTQDGAQVTKKYLHLKELLKICGCQLSDPFMTLSFMSLVVIPEIKIGEHGLFSYDKFYWL